MRDATDARYPALPDNHAMRAVLSAAGMRFARSGDDLTGVIEIASPLPPLAA